MNRSRKVLFVGASLAVVVVLAGAAMAVTPNGFGGTQAVQTVPQAPLLVEDSFEERGVIEAVNEALVDFNDDALAPNVIDREVIDAAVADTLGISTDELASLRDSGQGLPEIAESLGVDMEEVETAVAEAREEIVEEAVDEGTITQDEADVLLSDDGGRRGGPDGGRRGNGRDGNGGGRGQGGGPDGGGRGQGGGGNGTPPTNNNA